MSAEPGTGVESFLAAGKRAPEIPAVFMRCLNVLLKVLLLEVVLGALVVGALERSVARVRPDVAIEAGRSVKLLIATLNSAGILQWADSSARGYSAYGAGLGRRFEDSFVI